MQVIEADDAERCERLGRTTVQVLAKVLSVPRSEAKMSAELTTLARNAAADMKGNAVAAETPISEGGQTFGIHRCPQP